MFSESPILIRKSHLDSELQERLEWFLQQPGCNWTLARSEKGDQPELTITRRGVFLHNGRSRIAFHPSMAVIRLLNLLRGGYDRYLDATQLRDGDSLIDATLGLGTDTLIGAWAVGKSGNVQAIEKSPILAAIVQDGLNHFTKIIPGSKSKDKQDTWYALTQAAQRIKVCCGEHRDYLSCIPDNSVDVVYFDPMFRNTCKKSDSIQPLHNWSNHSPLEHKSILEACRIARRRVVLKERKNSSEFQRLGFEILLGGKYSPVDYGVIII
ncbi:class I SAM-dependent methyltransferase [Desulfosporosinus nitroreducens]|uniref:Class I SAM-dependent methyltransferase n=1 Tax=Desulfosporosinus nitroreducens TaxID=2018668 RepID=A0ABT8QJ60_9FIRM|nr:class I SAM-dependent methyltransferase [Desulfosporosinus nitroreducens]MDO0821321.1 class I SAM-dependent methyltransferase [Desulfosporosinus nitroreducens]